MQTAGLAPQVPLLFDQTSDRAKTRRKLRNRLRKAGAKMPA
jgi:hypothetical protein